MTDSKEAVWRILNRDLFFVRSAVKASELKTSEKYDVFDAETQQLVLECREPKLGILTKIARACGGRHDSGTAFDLVATLPENGLQAFRIARGSTTFSLGGRPVEVFDHANELIGRIRQKTFSFTGKFNFEGDRGHDSFVFEAQSNFLETASKLLIDGQEVGAFSSGWRGKHSEFFQLGKFG